ncbi:hypothetical protein IWX49DRAFT_594215 [Phyllosticta citricarpa]|uniref:DUF4536 domain-containing protein n=2 Tax=Phyllosticta TaxID=121621 RepID=A0ABR1LGZ8_9PEZI
MAKDEVTISPAEAKEKKRQEKMEAHAECSWCRFMGTGAFVGLGIYAYIKGHEQMHKDLAAGRKMARWESILRRGSINTTALLCLSIGAYRWYVK